MKIIKHFSRESFEVFPSIYIWFCNEKGIAFGWLFWILEIRKGNHPKVEDNLQSIKEILDLFLLRTGEVSQERIEWELDFKSHLLKEIEKLL